MTAVVDIPNYKLRLIEHDLPPEVYRVLSTCSTIAWDIETSGLDWRIDRIATCQLFVEPDEVYVVQVVPGANPSSLGGLIENAQITKVFHHAMFDLRFMSNAWHLSPRNVMCTKVASKILDPAASSHSLKDLLARHLGVTIEKTETKSDWFARLTDAQLAYAATDVIYLSRLLRELHLRLDEAGKREILEASYQYLPHRVALDLLGAGDIFTY